MRRVPHRKGWTYSRFARKKRRRCRRENKPYLINQEEGAIEITHTGKKEGGKGLAVGWLGFPALVVGLWRWPFSPVSLCFCLLFPLPVLFCRWFPGCSGCPALLGGFSGVWGVPCLLPPLPSSCLPVSALPLGRVAPWAFPSAPPPGLSPGSSRFAGFPRCLPPPGSPRPGRLGLALPAAGAVSARSLPPLALPLPGWFLSPLPLPRWRSVAAWRRVALLPCSRPVAACPLGLSRVASLPLLPAAPAVVGFSGGRRLSPAFRPLAAGVVSAVLAAGRSVAVGCAGGLDSFVRSAAPGAVVFSVPGAGRRPAAWFAARSVALVRFVAAGSAGSGFVVFPAVPCPAGLSPSSSSSACFCGLGSGSWASAALAAGLGLPLVVFPCGFSALPPWGRWVPAGRAAWAGGFRLAGA